MRSILVIGCNGFSGKTLLSVLEENKEWIVFGADLGQVGSPLLSQYFPCSLTDPVALKLALAQCRPDYVINLAASFTNDPIEDFAVNHQGTKNLLDALLELALTETKVLLIGSSAEYGPGDPEQAISEESYLAPQSVYGQSKIAQYELFLEYRDRLPLLLARSFNLIGPKAPLALFAGMFFNKVQEFLTHQTDHLCLRDLSAYRDYLDIRDAAKAYLFLLDQGQAGEVYNVAQGAATQMLEIVTLTLEMLQIPQDKLSYEIDTAFRGVAYQIADISKIKALGWQPAYHLQESLAYILETL